MRIDPLVPVKLSERTMFALRCAAEGLTLPAIAEAMTRRFSANNRGHVFNRQNVDYYLSEARLELGVETTVQAVYAAAKRGLI